MNKIQLKGITWDHSRGFDPLVATSKLYEESNQVTISWEKRNLKDFGDQSLEDLASNYDLLIIDHPHSGVAASQNCVLPLDTYMDASELELLRSQSGGPSFDSYYYKGHQWALPIDAALQTAVYRPDLLKKKLPSTWAEVLKIEQLGMALCPTDSLCSFLTLTAQFGTPIQEKNQFLVDEKKGIEILELMKLLVKNSHPKSLDWNPIQLFDYMAEFQDISYAPLAFNYSNYSRAGYRKNMLLFSNAPEVKNAVLGGAGIAVSANCLEPQVAVSFANWVCSAKVQKTTYVTASGQPANKMAWKDEKANSITHNFFNDTAASLENAFVRPRFTEWPRFQEHLGEVIHECLSKNTDTFKVIKYLNRKFEKLQSEK